jgi:hypothetical protein
MVCLFAGSGFLPEHWVLSMAPASAALLAVPVQALAVDSNSDCLLRFLVCLLWFPKRHWVSVQAWPYCSPADSHAIREWLALTAES